MTAFNERLRELRRERGLTQEALARSAGLSVSMVSKLEQHEMDPSFSTLRQLAEGLQVSILAFVEVDWLLFWVKRDGEPTRRHFEHAGVRLPKPKKAPATAQETPGPAGQNGTGAAEKPAAEKPAPEGQGRKRKVKGRE